MRIHLDGPDLVGLEDRGPAASVRLLLPRPEVGEIVVPAWNGNEFLEPDGRRPPIRTVTPLGTGPGVVVEVVLHGEAPLSSWAGGATPGDEVAVSGTGRGYEVDLEAGHHLLAGDESALPAISTVLAALGPDASAEVIVEHRHGTERVDLPAHPGAEVRWFEQVEGAPPGSALVPAVLAWSEASATTDVRIWAAGEAAAVQRIRRHLLEDVGLPRSSTVIRGYWKHGRTGT